MLCRDSVTRKHWGFEGIRPFSKFYNKCVNTWFLLDKIWVLTYGDIRKYNFDSHPSSLNKVVKI